MSKESKNRERICGTIDKELAEWVTQLPEKSDQFYNISHVVEVAIKNLKKKIEAGEDVFESLE